jgi:hypothetical protein
MNYNILTQEYKDISQLHKTISKKYKLNQDPQNYHNFIELTNILIIRVLESIDYKMDIILRSQNYNKYSDKIISRANKIIQDEENIIDKLENLILISDIELNINLKEQYGIIDMFYSTSIK